MEHIGERLVWHYVPGTDTLIPLGGLNPLTIGATLLVMILLFGLLWLATRKLAWIPGRAQLAVELFLGGFDAMVTDTLEFKTREANRHFLPLIATLFIFVILCNGIPLLPIPDLEEPTSDLNCTLGLGSMVVMYSMYCGFKHHGVRAHLSEMLGPFWHHEGKFTPGALFGKLIGIGFFFPLSIVENVSRMMSISFRLFGNITGGAVVLTVISALSYGVVIPIGLQAFVFLFEAAVQAFVFSTLTLVYISTNTQHEG